LYRRLAAENQRFPFITFARLFYLRDKASLLDAGVLARGLAMSDGELVRQALDGRPQAYEELVRRWAGRVTALCHAKLGRADAADDMAQEALMRGYRALHSLVEPEKFGPWLCGIAVRACLDWLKSKARTQIPFSALGPDRQPESFLSSRADAQERADELQQLTVEVEALPEQYREVLMLYYYDDVTYRDLADMLGVSPATINARLTKARAILRERLGNRIRK
jgi:RNA polymerase sigma-70 factor (ECF subfamily)